MTKKRKGQQWRHRRFTHDQVRAIRNSGQSQMALAIKYGVTKCSIWKIKNRISYEEIPDHVEDPHHAE